MDSVIIGKNVPLDSGTISSLDIGATSGDEKVPCASILRHCPRSRDAPLLPVMAQAPARKDIPDRDSDAGTRPRSRRGWTTQPRHGRGQMALTPTRRGKTVAEEVGLAMATSSVLAHPMAVEKEEGGELGHGRELRPRPIPWSPRKRERRAHPWLLMRRRRGWRRAWPWRTGGSRCGRRKEGKGDP